MRGIRATLATAVALLLFAGAATGAGGGGGTGIPAGVSGSGTGIPGGAGGTGTASPGGATTPTALRPLAKALHGGLHAAGRSSGAYVADMNTGQTLFASAPDVRRLPASVEKLYTTSTALLRFGPDANLLTSVLGDGTLSPTGTFTGTLYIRGGGDPTFGSTGFDRLAYGTGATMQRLVADLITGTGINELDGSVIGDESYFDSARGTPATGFRFSPFVEGSLSALAYDRGLVNQGSAFVKHPALFAAQQLLAALKGAGVRVPGKARIGVGLAPASATTLTAVHSPKLATLIRLTNTPSDNFFAEMLIKGLGAKFGTSGTTAAGAAVVRSQLARSFHIHPQLVDGSGLSLSDRTSPREVVTALEAMATNSAFVSSLAVAGETGTLEGEMRGTVAQGRCRGKTGTLSDVSNLVGYCQARDGHVLAFAFLMNSIDPNAAHPIQDKMAVALAKYDG
jgi:serine-type D-Ala-D-Ala carboxypeptidase/endopeptidase (penicillin-binding protein 4)